MDASKLMQYIITGKLLDQLTNCAETQRKALNTHTGIVKDSPQLSHSGPRLRQTSGTDLPIKV